MELKGSQQKRANQTIEATKATRTAANSLSKLNSWLEGASISARPTVVMQKKHGESFGNALTDRLKI
jgi:hypothetical protein